MAYPLTKCLMLSLIIGIVFAVLQIISTIAVAVDFKAALEDYKDNGKTIIEDALLGPEVNFNETSAWFVALSAEYDALSSFDKEYVYCDVKSIQSSPKWWEDVATNEWEAVICLLAFFSCGGLAIIVGNLMCKKFNPFYDVDMADIKASDPENPFSKAVIAQSHWNKTLTKEEKLRKNLQDYRADTAYLFLASGPLLAVYWILVERRSMVSGFDCQALFYACGQSGECGMDDLMLTVPLNSSLVKMIFSYGIITWSFLTCLASLVFVLTSGTLITIGSRVFGFLWLPLFMFFYSLVPFAWVYFADEHVPIQNSGLVGVFALLLLAFFGELLWVCCFICRSCKGTTGF